MYLFIICARSSISLASTITKLPHVLVLNVSKKEEKGRVLSVIHLHVFGELQHLFLQFCIDLLVLLHLRLEPDALLSQSTAFLFQYDDLFIRVFLLEFTVVLRHPDKTENGFSTNALRQSSV